MRGLDERSILARYTRGLRRYPLLDSGEEHALAVQLLETGSAAVRARLITANLRLVVKIALECRRNHASVLDLIQEGNLGLLRAVAKFDPHRGVKLATYAAWWIRAYILKFIQNNWHVARITASRAHRKLFSSLAKEREKLEKQGLPADAQHLAVALDVPEGAVVEMEQQMKTPCASLDAPLRLGGGEEQARTLAEILSGDPALRPDVRVEAAELDRTVRRNVDAVATTLDERELDILLDGLSAEEPTSRTELARRLGVTRERVRQIEAGIKKRLCRRLTAELGDAI